MPAKTIDERSASGLVGGDRGDLLADGRGLARQRRLVHLRDRSAWSEAAIGRHAVALPQDDEVAGDETVRRDRDAAPAADDRRDAARRPPQGEERALRPASWTNPSTALSTTIAAITAASSRSPISERDRCRHHEEQDERVRELTEVLTAA